MTRIVSHDHVFKNLLAHDHRKNQIRCEFPMPWLWEEIRTFSSTSASRQRVSFFEKNRKETFQKDAPKLEKEKGPAGCEEGPAGREEGLGGSWRKFWSRRPTSRASRLSSIRVDRAPPPLTCLMTALDPLLELLWSFFFFIPSYALLKSPLTRSSRAFSRLPEVYGSNLPPTPTLFHHLSSRLETKKLPFSWAPTWKEYRWKTISSAGDLDYEAPHPPARECNFSG
ncbi:unnamed protein product [Nesidiocoris tenuis]|uniref:Uncharacterized protein n=1 Tax=Nesidiocoris tenuis TaxID=355587 RepID=A0A6H5HTD3_9HEMI|nr:unnamed protein product [Nesidiocoris tenuis]